MIHFHRWVPLGEYLNWQACTRCGRTRLRPGWIVREGQQVVPNARRHRIDAGGES